MRAKVNIPETLGWEWHYHVMGIPGDPLGQGGVLTFNRTPVLRVDDDGGIELFEEILKDA